MFTGLVEERGKVNNITRTSQSVRITIGADKVLADVKIGDSIAVNGTCLTAVDYNTKSFTADVMPETVNRTVLATLKPGDIVNLERCLKVGDRLGGHIVSGHIDGIGTITAKQRNDIAIMPKAQGSCNRTILHGRISRLYNILHKGFRISHHKTITC